MPIETSWLVLHPYIAGPGPGRRGRKRKDTKSAGLVTTDDEGGQASEVEDRMVNGNAQKPARRNPTRRAAQNGGLSEGEPGVTEDEHEAAAATTTPKPKPRPVRKRGSPAKRAREESPVRTQSPTPLSSVRGSTPAEEPEEPEEPQDPETPKASRKRSRSDDEEQEDEELADAATTTNGVDHDDGDDEASPEAQVSELNIRRKRVRH